MVKPKNTKGKKLGYREVLGWAKGKQADKPLSAFLQHVVLTDFAGTLPVGKEQDRTIADTGLYETKRYIQPFDPRIDGITFPPSLNAVLTRLESTCRAVLAKYVTKDWPTAFQVLRDTIVITDRELAPCKRLMRRDSAIARNGGPQVNDVLEAIYLAKRLRFAVENSLAEIPVDSISETAIELGRVIERLGVRPAEPYVMGAKQRTKTLATSRRKPNETRAGALALFARLIDEGQLVKKAESRARVEFGVAPRTLRRWLKGS